MSFSKAKLKRFNDVDVGCASPASSMLKEKGATGSCGGGGGENTSSSSTSSSVTGGVAAHSERREQIEKFFKDAVRFASSKDNGNNKESAQTAVNVKDVGVIKEDKKSKGGLRLFRTPSLPQRLRFRHHTDTSNGTTSSTPLHSAVSTPVKETTTTSKSASRLKGKEALQQEIRNKNDLITGYLSQIDVLQRHVEQLRATEQKLREDHANGVQKTEELVVALTTENTTYKELHSQLSVQHVELSERCRQFETQLQQTDVEHENKVCSLLAQTEELQANVAHLEAAAQQQAAIDDMLRKQIEQLEKELSDANEKLLANELIRQEQYEQLNNTRNTNDALRAEVQQLQQQIDANSEAHTQEVRSTHNEMECLRNERNTLKGDLASKCELIRSLQEELLDKNCEIDAHCDTIRQLCREQAQHTEQRQKLEAAEVKLRNDEAQMEQKLQQIESEMDAALEREKQYWRNELEKRQKLAENELIKIELEKQDVMVLLESTNDMLRARDEKLQKYEEQIRNGIDYYVQLTDNLQQQVVDLKQEVAKLITEKYNYQLTLNNTRSTVNILMERLKKSDADVEQFKAELESVQLAKGALEQSYLTLQTELEAQRAKLSESHEALGALRSSAQVLQHEVSLKEAMFEKMLTSEDDTMSKLNKIASSFQERIDMNAAAAHYLELYNDMKSKDETREVYMHDMRRALDDFATVLQFAQLELDSKEKTLAEMGAERDQLKLENVSLKARMEEYSNSNNINVGKKENITDLEKIEDLLIDSDLRNECDKITSWLLSTTASPEKCVRVESTHEINELLKSHNTPTKTRHGNATPIRQSSSSSTTVSSVRQSTVATTPRSPRSPHTAPRTPKTPQRTPITTPKKNVTPYHPGKENIPSPQKQVLKTRNM